MTRRRAITSEEAGSPHEWFLLTASQSRRSACYQLNSRAYYLDHVQVVCAQRALGLIFPEKRSMAARFLDFVPSLLWPTLMLAAIACTGNGQQHYWF
jgi:hypothetical protein